ncbi:MAG: Ku protein [Erysipelotrichaceae bacterium]|nr:Ku protein [Erysipelotrichaceae bacterium]
MAVTYKGAISFGLVHIPIELYRTTQSIDLTFHQLCKKTKERVRYKKYCPNCNKDITKDDIIKGYEYAKDQYVLISDDEMESLKEEKDRTIEILHITQLEDIDDLYYEKNYYAIPNQSGTKAYELLYKSLKSMKVVAIGQCVIGTKETLVAIVPAKDCLLVKTLFYNDEIVELPKDIKHPKVSSAELKMAKQLLEAMKSSFDPTKYHDTFQEKLRNVIEAKIHGKEIVSTKELKEDTPMNLMEALTKSVEQLEKRA